MEHRPNILFLFSDQHRADALGCAGHPVVQTPNLDRLAGEGVRFENAYCATPLCSPSRISLATGRFPHNSGHEIKQRDGGRHRAGFPARQADD